MQELSNRNVHFATLMDLCHLINASLTEHLQTSQGRVVLPGENIKDDTGGSAVFTEKGASASHLTAAPAWDTISRLPDMLGEANDAVSAYTQVNVSDASRWLKLTETACRTVWIMLPRHRRRNIGITSMTPWSVGPQSVWQECHGK